MPKVVLYIAASLDGYIADSNGSVEWLAQFQSQDYGYEKFFNSVETLIMGAKTFEQIQTFGKWPYMGKKTYVFSMRSLEFPEGADVELYYTRPSKLIYSLKRHTKKDIWLVGGSRMIATFLSAGLVDQMRIFIMPTLLGHGIPLFRNLTVPLSLNFIEQKTFKNSVIELVYQPQTKKKR